MWQALKDLSNDSCALTSKKVTLRSLSGVCDLRKIKSRNKIFSNLTRVPPPESREPTKAVRDTFDKIRSECETQVSQRSGETGKGESLWRTHFKKLLVRIYYLLKNILPK